MRALKLSEDKAKELEGYYGIGRLEPIPFEDYFVLPISTLSAEEFEDIRADLKKLEEIDIEFDKIE